MKINKIDFAKACLFLIVIMGLLTLIISMTSCNTVKKAEKQQDKIIRDHPAVALKRIRDFAPCITTSILHIKDSTDYKKWQDSVTKVNDFYDSLLATIEPTVIIHDTTHECDEYRNNEIKFNKIIKHLTDQNTALNFKIKNAKPVHDTIIRNIEDLAQVYQKDIELQETIKERNKLSTKLEKRNTLIMWLLIFLAGLSIPYIIKAVQFFTIKKLPL